jgi:hypothetical protein
MRTAERDLSANGESEKQTKLKLIGASEEQRNKLEQMATIESVRSLILSRSWPMNAGSDWPGNRASPTLKPSRAMDNSTRTIPGREKLRRAILGLVAERIFKIKQHWLNFYRSSNRS